MGKSIKKENNGDGGLELLQSASVKPPAAPEVEMSVLGAMLIDKEAVPKVVELLSPSSFYMKEHQTIYEAMLSIFNANEPIDTVSLYEELKKRGVIESCGGAVYISKLSQNIASAANVEYHAKIILEKHILRSIIESSLDTAKMAYSNTEDAFDLLDEAERKIFQIAEEHFKKSYKQMDRAVKEAMEYIESIHSNQAQSFSVPTGFYQLDDLLGGFQKSDLIIIAARPSMGKTAFALSLARNAAIDHKVPVAIFSLEMATVQIVIRMLCSEAKIDIHSVRAGKLPDKDGQKLSRNIHKLSEAPIYIDDSPAQTILEIRSKVRRLKAEKNVGLVIIDYLQLMSVSSKMESREREISHISRSLKSLAKELNIPVVALAQLNRAVESRNDKRPMLSDLRESGSIEQDADVVLFLHRPEYYGLLTDKDGNSNQGVAEVIVGKQRNGPTGDARLMFIKEHGRFENGEFQRQIEESGVSVPKISEEPII